MAVRPSAGLHFPHPTSLALGDKIRVRRNRSHAFRTAVVIDVRGSESISTGHIVVVRWQDDHTISGIIPGTEVEVIKTNKP